ncbi:breast cancer type 1 susceptibility protein homolog [Copidosoma floridanum]|uniref:breast cancer type 1 susceptibility protein homolog n=1 Tax=Copidosoma floridanum TaxID=29053 RepID=UPI0006C9BC21|nr:breast cancer type 1 susceptibility protein homolog [Copidosoma floridanum]
MAEKKKGLSQICSELVNEVEDVIQCPVCLEAKSSVVQCTIGHHVCETCRRKVQECPTCKSPFTATKSFIIEHLSKMVAKINLSIRAFNDDIPVDTTKDYRQCLKTLLTRLSEFLNYQNDVMLYLKRYLERPSPQDNNTLQTKINFLVCEIKNINVYMNETTKKLIDLKEK